MRIRIPVFVALFVLGQSPLGRAADAGVPPFEPKSHGIQRYEAIWKRSPFIVETVAVQTSVGLAGRFSLVGIITIGGKPKAFIVDNTVPDPVKNRLLVSVGEASKGSGVELVSVNMDPDPRKSSAVIKLGAQQATLPFNTASLAPQGPNIAPGAVPPPPTIGQRNSLRPPTVVPPGTAQPALPQSTIPTPPPPSRRIIRPPVNLTN